ncbi:hypothetical protein NE237_031643 [Protea cynaroides]|uniref:Uncharacterized protein n=1 Tax=Protea cynaroides TaxID=273540 RepID=A0A9Q0L2I6_9MAGN|nr:hypothetical protein NE237_031643 [Protea cynaroides]
MRQGAVLMQKISKFLHCLNAPRWGPRAIDLGIGMLFHCDTIEFSMINLGISTLLGCKASVERDETSRSHSRESGKEEGSQGGGTRKGGNYDAVQIAASEVGALTTMTALELQWDLMVGTFNSLRELYHIPLNYELRFLLSRVQLVENAEDGWLPRQEGLVAEHICIGIPVTVKELNDPVVLVRTRLIGEDDFWGQRN